MSRHKKKETPPGQRQHPGIRAKIYVRDDMIGGGKIELLRVVHEKGSISAAGREMGMNYRRAWFLLDTLQSCFSTPLLETERGGGEKAGTRLTPLGLDLLTRFDTHQLVLAEVSADFLGWLENNQATD